MAVVVVAPHRDQRGPRVDGPYQIRILECGAVMGHLQHVGAQLRLGAKQRCLGRGLHVAGEQHPDPGVLGVQDEAGVVGRRALAVDESPRPDQPPGQTPHDATLPHRADRHGDARGRRPAAHPIRLIGRIVERRNLHLPDRPAAQHTGQALHVIGVKVGEHHEGDMADSKVAQAAIDQRRVGPGVDHHGGSCLDRQDESVALAHVAGHQHPPGRWPAGREPREHRA
jgi:hypothetical protein